MILDYFDCESNKTALVKTYSVTKDSQGREVKSYVDGSTIEGYLQTTQKGTANIGDQWTPIYKKEFICEPPFIVAEKDRLLIDSILYEIDDLDDVGNQGEVLVIGLNEVG